jgi:DNA polymerase
VEAAGEAADPPEAELARDRRLPTLARRRGRGSEAATAAQALLGRDFRVSRQRGELVDSPLAPNAIATVHPSSILRAEDREREYREFVRDLDKIAALIRTA